MTASPLRGTPPGVGPASGWLEVPAQQNPADPYGTGSVDAPVNSMLTAIIQMGYDIERIAKTFVVNLLFPDALHTTFPVLPANGGTKALDITIPDGDNITVKVDSDAGTLGATMQVFPEDPRTHVVDTEHPLTADENGFVTLEKGKSYQILLTSETKAAQANWEDVLAKDNVKLQYYQADKATAIGAPFKFTVFWLKLDVPSDLLLGGGPVVDPSKDLPDAPVNWLGVRLRDLTNAGPPKTTKAGRQVNDTYACGVILIRGAIVPQHMDPAHFRRDWNGSKGFDFRQWIWARHFINDGFAEADYVSGERWNLDGRPDVLAAGLLPHEAQDSFADKDGSPNDLFIYLVDAPGYMIALAPVPDDVLRERLHFMDFVFYDDQLCSDGNPNPGEEQLPTGGYIWSSNQSTLTTAAGKLSEKDDLNWNGDNKVVVGVWQGDLSTTLSAGTPTVPFRPQVASVTNAGAREKDPYEVILQAGLATRNMTITGEDFPDAALTITPQQTKGTAKTIGVSNSQRSNASELTTTFDFTAHGITAASEYRLKVQIGDTIVTLVDSRYLLIVIGEVKHWTPFDPLHPQFNFINVPLGGNNWVVYYVATDELGHLAKGTDAPPVTINTKDPDGTIDLVWTSDTTAVQDAAGGYRGRFARSFRIDASGSTKFEADYNGLKCVIPALPFIHLP